MAGVKKVAKNRLVANAMKMGVSRMRNLGDASLRSILANSDKQSQTLAIRKMRNNARNILNSRKKAGR